VGLAWNVRRPLPESISAKRAAAAAGMQVDDDDRVTA
jgi:stearoyl-CoA desaturase (delta-9 desaturase)